MAWYAYCIAEQQAFLAGARARRPFPIEGLRGINDSQVLGYPSGEFAVVVSPYLAAGTLDQQAALDQARVVADCFRQTTVLPFRFGTVFETDEALRRAVRGNRKAFLESVQQLRGKSEMHLKVVVRDGSLRDLADTELPAAVGSAYLAHLRERAALQRDRQSKAKSLSVQVHKLFAPLAEEISCKKVDSGGLLIDIAHLIESNSIEKYHNRYASATKQLKNCELVMSGPWPPYHFMPGKKPRPA